MEREKVSKTLCYLGPFEFSFYDVFWSPNVELLFFGAELPSFKFPWQEANTQHTTRKRTARCKVVPNLVLMALINP